MIFLRLLLAKTLIILSFSQASALTCVQILDVEQKIEQSLSLPRELHISEENIKTILASPDAPYLLRVGTLFSKLEDSNLLKMVRYAFRSHQVNLDPFKGGFFRKGASAKALQDRIKAAIGREIEDPKKLVEIWNTEAALKKNLEDSFLSDNELTLLAYILSFSFNQIHFSNGNELGRIDFLNRAKAETINTFSDFILASPVHRRTFSRVLQDPKLIETLNLLLKLGRGAKLMNGISVIPSELRHLSLNSIRLGQNQNSKALLVFVLILMENPHQLEEYSFHRGFGQNLILHGRERALSLLEDQLFEIMDSPLLIEKVIDLFDLHYTGTELPLGIKATQSLLINGAKSALLPIKARASEQKAQEAAQKSPNLAPRTTSFRSYNPVTEVLSTKEPERRNPRKRRNQVREEGPIEGSLPETSSQIEYHTFPEDLSPQAGKPYSFQFLRNPELGEQKVIFPQDIVTGFEVQSKAHWAPFLKALNYGFTSRFGQNGIKKMGANIGLNNIYEIQPGVSSFRIILKREGKTWLALKMLHKDKVDPYIQSLQ